MKFLKVLVISSLQYNRMLHSPSLGGKCHIVVATLEVSLPEKCQCLEVNKAQFLHALCYCTKYPVSISWHLYRSNYCSFSQLFR